ncbi:hypothetical protein D3C72_1877250 [compost metagenome]
MTQSNCTAMAALMKRCNRGEHHRQSHSVVPSAGTRSVSDVSGVAAVSGIAPALVFATTASNRVPGTACTCVTAAHACTSKSRSTAQMRRTKFACLRIDGGAGCVDRRHINATQLQL